MGKDQQIEVRLRFDSKKLRREKIIKMAEYCLKPFGIEVWVKDGDYCGSERPPRKVFCQLPKGHKGSHRAVIFWED